jgi:nucleotide-binding universal stress UspA family protein
MMKILIPTDFSENSHNAIRYALEYFASIPVNFYILHVTAKKAPLNVEEEEEFFETSSKMNTVQNSAALLKEEINTCKLLAKNKSHSFFQLSEDINLVEAIRKNILEKEIDYILMGTKGASKIDRSDLGSKTSEVITKVKCSVIVIPENARFTKIKNLALLTDYNSIYRNKVISRLSEALKNQQAALRVLHIRPQNAVLSALQKDNKGFLHYFFKDSKHSFHFLENVKIESGIQDFVETWEIDMIAVVAKNLNLIQRLLFNSTNKSTTYNYEVPYLILHE